MNKNKGIIGIGLIIAIVFGIVVVSGGTYYFSKGFNNTNNENTGICGINGEFCPGTPGYEARIKREKQNQEIVENKQINCDSNSPSTIKVLSPNGGEAYNPGQKITIKWESCNVDKNSIGIILIRHDPSSSHSEEQGGKDYAGFTLGGYDGYDGFTDDGIEDITLPNSSNPNLVLGQYYTIVVMGSGDVSNIGSGHNPRDYSDDWFTIDSSAKNISTALPAKYLSSQNWPPVVKISNFAYSCKLSSGTGDVPTVIQEKTINGKKYCITSLIDAGAGSRFGEYAYTTPNISGSGTKTISFNLRWSSCGGYGAPGEAQYDECMITVSTFLNRLDEVVDSLM
jgi:hypothetical protein